MPKRQITHNEVLDYLTNLPYNQFKSVVEHYSTHTKTDFEKEMDTMITLNFQERLTRLGVNNTCPKCGSERIKKNGTKNHVQLFKCNNCNTKFSLFTNTILEKTKWHWDIWIKVLEMTINNYSLQSMVNVLEKDFGCVGINIKTVWLWRLKLIHALASLPQPKLTGIVQIDETFIRESQKGSRQLVSYLDKKDIRKPRYGRKPSQYGVMGSEFATITTAIDNTGHCVCKVSGLGRLTKEVFVDLFEKHIDKPSFICSDANNVYEDYCTLFNIPHYERPSNYLTVIQNAGYETPDYTNLATAKLTEEKNNKILEKLFLDDAIDRITNRGYMSYEEFIAVKKANSLSLGRVNELHSDIKKFINKEMTNVSTKYLNDYIGFFTYIRNWRVDNGHYPTSQKDTELLFIEILRSKSNITIAEIDNKELDLPKPSSRYITLLKEETKKARKATSNKYFKFDEEDGFKTFNKREYLLDQPKYKLLAICKECKLSKYRQLALWSLVSLILKQPNIDAIIYKLLAEDRHYSIAEEDLEAINASKYSH